MSDLIRQPRTLRRFLIDRALPLRSPRRPTPRKRHRATTLADALAAMLPAPLPLLFLASVVIAGCSGAAASRDAASGDAARGNGSGLVSFAVFGDMPYIAGLKDPAPVLAAYANLLADVDASSSDFVVHLGDITNGPYCGDSMMMARFRELDGLSHPFFYTFGDNEWTDCARGGFDPLERLAKLREIFTRGDSSLGRRRMALERQSTDPRFQLYRENVRWRVGNVLYLILHIPGSNNNWGNGAVPSEEYQARNRANLAWLRDAFELARRQGDLGVAIFIQADPAFDRSQLPESDLKYVTGFDDFLAALHRDVVDFGRPVMLFHGDSHYFRIDKPLVDTATGKGVMNFTRVEGFGAANHHWVRVTVDPADPNLFRVEPKLVRANLP